MIKDLHHVNIHVDDLEAAEAFYIGVLGLERLPRALASTGAWLVVGTRQLHLSVKDVPADAGQHFAFEVESVEAMQDILAGTVHTMTGPFEIPGVCRQLFTWDPAGNRLEFNQPL